MSDDDKLVTYTVLLRVAVAVVQGDCDVVVAVSTPADAVVLCFVAPACEAACSRNFLKGCY